MNAVLTIGVCFDCFHCAWFPQGGAMLTPWHLNLCAFTSFERRRLSPVPSARCRVIFYANVKRRSFEEFCRRSLIRVLVGTLIFAFDGRGFFGEDALHYDYYGTAQVAAWNGDRYFNALMRIYVSGALAGAWGMVYMVAGTYALIGRNQLAVQLVVAVMGASTAPLIYLGALMFLNAR